MTCEIVNHIPDIKSKTFLELGYRDGANFKLIECKNKYSVDINWLADFTGTTDEFFESISPFQTWDIIFIDANHDYEFVLRDFNHAVEHAAEWVILHDMIPPTERHTEKRFCSDAYKVLYRLRMETDLQVYSMQGHMGLTFVRIPRRSITPTPFFYKLKSISCDLSYSDFMKFVKGIKLYNEDEIILQLCNTR